MSWNDWMNGGGTATDNGMGVSDAASPLDNAPVVEESAGAEAGGGFEPEADATTGAVTESYDDNEAAGDAAGDADGDGNAEPETENEADEDAVEENAHADNEPAVKKRRAKDTFPRINKKHAERLIDIISLLENDESALGAARYLTGVRRGDTADLIDALTDGRNKARIRKATELASGLAKADRDSLNVYLVMAFASNADGVQQVYELMHAVAPDCGVGRTPSKPTQDKWIQYAQDIAEHWPDELDLSVFERLCVMD